MLVTKKTQLLLTTLLMVSAISLRAEDRQAAPTEMAQEQVLIKKTRGLMLISGGGELGMDGISETSGVAASATLQIPGGVERLSTRLEPLFLDKPLTKTVIKDLERTIIQYYSDMNHPVVAVSLPPQQKLTGGVLKLIITEGKLDNVTVTGCKWSNSEKIAETIQIKNGELIDEKKLSADIAWLNRNPFRTVNAVYSPGGDIGTTNLEIQVDERTPFRVYAGADNTGLPQTGRTRYFVGGQAGNLGGVGHLASIQYTTSANFDDFQAITGSYTAPLQWRDLLTIFGGYSRVDVKAGTGSPPATGQSFQLSGRYEIPICSTQDFNPLIRFGIDFKRTDSVLLFSSRSAPTNQPKNAANLLQFLAAFRIQRVAGPLTYDFGADLYASTSGVLPQQRDADYQNLRVDAKSSYVYVQPLATAAYNYISDGRISLSVRGQIASENLLPSEQLGLGGMNSVRGYNEREKNVDNGVVANLELYAPSLRFKKWNTRLQALAFLDYGSGTEHIPTTAIPNPPSLISAGPGLRLSVDRYLTAQLDYGARLHRNSSFSKGDGRLHFSVIGSF